MEKINNIKELPIVALRGTVMFPNTVLTFDAGREKSIKAIEKAMENDEDRTIFLAAQINPEDSETDFSGVYHIGTIAKIRQSLRMPGGVIRVVAEGICRGACDECLSDEPYLTGMVQRIDIPPVTDENVSRAFISRLKSLFEDYFGINHRINVERYMKIINTQELDRLCDEIAPELQLDVSERQSILEIFDVFKRSEKLMEYIVKNISIMELERKISERVKASIDKNQREYYLREQLKVIEEELGDKDGIGAEVQEFRTTIKKLRLKKEVADKINKEVDRFAKTSAHSPEAGVIRSYINTVLSLPWQKQTKEESNISKAQKILDEDHYGLEKVKERIIEYLSVRHFVKNPSSILCLVGPPGVGKTSIVKSIARALNRKYVRISLGGVHDEADIRGHRKTYIGSMPGRIMSAMELADSKNPVMLLDEIDKMGKDYRGDPSAALLEVLDKEQNFAFRDHYLEVPFDLSNVMFITTANTLDTISRPLLDRMEIIEISGYTREEKLNIAKKYLLPKALKTTGLKEKNLIMTDDAIFSIIDYYTKESGVRKLEQKIIAICRKSAKKFLIDDTEKIEITDKNISEFLGKQIYSIDMMNKKNEIGVVRGLAWTAVGGDTLSVEVNVMKGSGKTELTGQLGDVMKESAKAAISYIRSKSDDFNIKDDFYKNKDIHIHVPEGAVPKDGPSAGITMATALISALTNRPVRADVAMTGEITIRGRVLAIGGLKEKSLAAYRAGIKNIIMPKDNEKDLDDIPQNIRKNINFIPVENMDDVIKNALVKKG